MRVAKISLFPKYPLNGLRRLARKTLNTVARLLWKPPSRLQRYLRNGYWQFRQLIRAYLPYPLRQRLKLAWHTSLKTGLEASQKVSGPAT